MSATRTATVAIVTAGLALFGGALLLAPTAHATFPGRNGQIAYGVEGEYEESAWIPIGIEAIRPGHPSPSPKLLFSHDPVVPSSCIADPSYSADGKLIAFDATWVSSPCEPYPPPSEPLPWAKNIFVMSASGGEVRQVTREPYVEDSDPGFSPSGDQIVFSRTAHRETQIYTINTDGSNLHQLTAGPKDQDLSPRYSPDGKHIVFDSKNGIEEMNSDGSGRHLLVANRGKYKVAEADFSPNGKLVTFVKAQAKGWLFIAKANGKAARRLSPAKRPASSLCFHVACAASPIFSPDGKWILFAALESGGGSRLAEVPVSGRRRRVKQIVSREFDIVRPTWQPLP